MAGFGSVALDSYWGNAWPWIGVTDNTQEGTCAYESDGSIITFVPIWYFSYNSQYDNCIVIGSNEYAIGDWEVKSCSYYTHKSICESLLNK